MINKIIANKGMTILIQSEDDAFGLFFIISRVAGYKTMMNITSANAEIISVQSIIDPYTINFTQQKNKTPALPGF
jgi:hypothetical protein